MSRWTQERNVPKLRYDNALDPKGRGWHYIWEGAGFGVQVFATGRRKWIQSGSIKNDLTGKHSSYFRALGNVEEIQLAEARRKAARVKVDARDRTESVPSSDSSKPRSPSGKKLARTTLEQALEFYVGNRNCAPSSKTTLESLLRHHLADWMSYSLLAIDSSLLLERYRLVIESMRDRGKALDARHAELATV